MTIHQNISHITQTGTTQSITADIAEMPISDSVISGFFIISFLIVALCYHLGHAYINKSCAGCKRLKQCEKDIARINQVLEVEKQVDFNVLKQILKQVELLKKKVMQNGKLDQ